MPLTENAWVAGTLSALFGEFEKYRRGRSRRKSQEAEYAAFMCFLVEME